MPIIQNHFLKLMWIMYQFINVYDELLEDLHRDKFDYDYNKSRTRLLAMEIKELQRSIKGNEL